jgi:hypothetical protein
MASIPCGIYTERVPGHGPMMQAEEEETHESRE